MVYLNGEFIEKDKAFVSVMDRGFLFGDSVYEVLPVYKGNVFRIKQHLKRLNESLKSIKITNPHRFEQWDEIIKRIIDHNPQHINQYIYLQVTRGCDIERNHTYKNLTPTIYIQSSPLEVRTKDDILKGFCAITRDDIRWNKCDAKVTSLIANIMYAQEAKQNNVEEVILCRNNVATECSSSNLFIVKNGFLYTHPKGSQVLPGITREIVIECANYCGIKVEETPISKEHLFNADEVFISSSKREILPITKIDGISINQEKIGDIWSLIYDHYQDKKINS